jgi:hypothetical protein
MKKDFFDLRLEEEITLENLLKDHYVSQIFPTPLKKGKETLEKKIELFNRLEKTIGVPLVTTQNKRAGIISEGVGTWTHDGTQTMQFDCASDTTTTSTRLERARLRKTTLHFLPPNHHG